MSVELCIASTADLEACAQIMASAMGPVEPTLRWYFPKPPTPPQLLAIMEIWMEDAYHDGTLITAKSTDLDNELATANQILGVAIWHKECPQTSHNFKKYKGLWRRLRPIMGLHSWRYFYEAWAANHARKSDNQCYLAGLAVAEPARGQGIAGQLISSPPCTGIPLVLECRQELVPFYRSHGFHVENTYCLPGVTKMYSMRKEYS